MEETTIKDIAKKCGVGVSTVSRALNNHPDINPETRKKIMDVINETGFIPNNSARNLKRTDAKCIAVLVKGITNPFFSGMIRIVEEEMQKEKYALVLRHVEAYEDSVNVALELEKEKRIRGIIFFGGSFYHLEEKLGKLKVPFVFTAIGIGITEQNNNLLFSNVTVDDRTESQKMTEYLLSLGHRDIAMITEGSEDPSVAQLRLEGFRKAYQEAGLEINEKLICYVDKNSEHYSMENGYMTTKRLLKSKEHFTAIFAAADIWAIGACRALHEAGLRVPEDVSVAGYDGIDLGNYYIPKLTTVKQPDSEMANTAVRLLLDIIAGKCENRYVVLPGILLKRESTARLKKR